VILGLYALKDRLGLGLLFAFVAAHQFLQHLLAVTVHVEVLGRYSISPGSAVLFSSGLFAVLVLYINEDVPSARRLIYGLLIANASAAGALALTGWALTRGLLVSEHGSRLPVIHGWDLDTSCRCFGPPGRLRVPAIEGAMGSAMGPDRACTLVSSGL
jgi:hypothetical protein